MSERGIKTRFTDWEDFVRGTGYDLSFNYVTGYHPIVPFKYYKKTIEHSLKSWWADYSDGEYDLLNRNCEHGANSWVYGINYSEQASETGVGKRVAKMARDRVKFAWEVTKWIFTFGNYERCINDVPDDRVNNNKGSTINLKDEINSWDANGKFSNLTSNELRDTRDEYQEQYLIQIAPKQDCRIM